MYNELTTRFLVGGWVSPRLYVDLLANAEVTHIVNTQAEPLPQIIKQQFVVIQCDEGEMDFPMPNDYWYKLFEFTSSAYHHLRNKIYFHVPTCSEPVSPVACYAGVRALGYGAIDARRRLENLHPIVKWHEAAMAKVDEAFVIWAKRIKPNPIQARRQLGHLIKDVEKEHKTRFGFQARLNQSTVI
jgi:hypothetical protein